MFEETVDAFFFAYFLESCVDVLIYLIEGRVVNVVADTDFIYGFAVCVVFAEVRRRSAAGGEKREHHYKGRYDRCDFRKILFHFNSFLSKLFFLSILYFSVSKTVNRHRFDKIYISISSVKNKNPVPTMPGQDKIPAVPPCLIYDYRISSLRILTYADF